MAKVPDTDGANVTDASTAREAPADDEWAPLAPAQSIAHPGEQADLVPSQQHEARRQQLLEQQAAADALAALQQRIAAAGPANSLLASVRDRESDAAKAARSALIQAVGTKPGAAKTAAATAALVADASEPLVDPREQESWFLRLPMAEQQRLRQQWQHRQVLLHSQPPWQRRLAWQRFAAAVLVFASLVFLGTGAVWVATLGAGIVCGICWRYTSADRYRDPVVAVALLFAGHVVAMLGGGTGGLPPGLFLDVLLLVVMAALVGMTGEMRRTGGFDVS